MATLTDYENALRDVALKSEMALGVQNLIGEAQAKVASLSEQLIKARNRAIEIATSDDQVKRTLTHSTALEIALLKRDLDAANAVLTQRTSELAKANAAVMDSHNAVVSVATELSATAIVDTQK